VVGWKQVEECSDELTVESSPKTNPDIQKSEGSSGKQEAENESGNMVRGNL
jgi:hypothetical protein